MSTKSQTVFAICFGLFLAVVVTVSLLFADKLPHAIKVTHLKPSLSSTPHLSMLDELLSEENAELWAGMLGE